MKNKLAGILICVMILVTIVPITTLATPIASEPHTRAGGLLSRTTVRGIVLFKRTSDFGKLFHFFAIRLHYSTISLSGEHSSGIIRMKSVEIPSSIIGYVGHNYIFGSFRGWLTP